MAAEDIIPFISSFKPKSNRLTCTSCKTLIEFILPNSTHPDLNSHSWSTIQSNNFVYLKCYNCKAKLKINLLGNLDQSTTTSSNSKLNKRQTGTDQQPLETDYYDELMVPTSATAAEIKKAYYQLAMRFHPDKTGGDLEASERRISEAYQILSDPKLRKQYNENGKQTGPEGGFAEPATFFKSQFGGDSFADIIGDISLFQDLENLMETEDESLSESDKKKKTEAQLADKARLKEERIVSLTEKLTHKLGLYTETPMDARSLDAYEQICKLEADELKNENYGVFLLHSIGHTYLSKSKQYLASNSFGSMWYSMTEKTHVVSETVSTVRSAIDLSRTFKQLNEAKEKGNLTEDEQRKLEEMAAHRGFEMLWKGSKMEIQSVLREVCDRVLGEKSLSKEKVHARAMALKILGRAYESVEGENISMLGGTFSMPESVAGSCSATAPEST